MGIDRSTEKEYFLLNFTEFYWFYWEIGAKKSAEKSLGTDTVSSNFIPIYLNFPWILLNFVNFIEWKESVYEKAD